MDGQTDSRYSGGISSFIASSIRVGLGRKGKVLWEGKGSGVAARRREVSTSSPPALGPERLGRCADCGLTRRNDALSTDEAESRLAPIESNGGFSTTEGAPTAAG